MRLELLFAVTLVGCALEAGPIDDVEAEDESLLIPGWAIIDPARGCDGTSMGGVCAGIAGTDIDLWDNLAWDGARWLSMNDRISSISVTAGQAALLCDGYAFDGGCRFFTENVAGASYSLPSYVFDNGVPMNDRTSSIEIHRAATIPWWSGFWYQANHPSDRANEWSHEAQGWAHDASGKRWFVADRWNIYTYPVSANLANDEFTDHVDLPPACNHVGDIDYYGGYLYAPLEGCPDGPRVYVYDGNLDLVRWARLASQSSAAWIAINPTNGLLYGSEFDADRVHVYPLAWSTGSTISAIYSVRLDRIYPRVQGGAFSVNGHFYLVSDDWVTPSRAGTYAFRFRGRSSALMRYIHPNGYRGGYGEELEGITIWNLDGVAERHPSVNGHVHFLLLDNDIVYDEVYGKHFSVDYPQYL